MSYLRFLKNYNNYYNRIVKIDQLADIDNEYVDLQKANFNPNDDVTASHDTAKWTVDWMPDYMLKINEETEEIESRWFVLESVRLRGQQYRFTLRRDLVADFYDNIITAPIHIERAMVNSIDNPLLYNPEGFSFNQIKKEETLLKDKTNSAWYILYFKEPTEKSDSFTIPTNYDIQINGSLASSIYAAGTQKYCENFNINTNFVALGSGGYYGQGWKQINTASDITYNSFETPNVFVPNIHNTTNECKTELTRVFTGQFAALKSRLETDNVDTSTLTEAEFLTLKNIGTNGIRVYSVADSKIYNVTVTNAVSVKNGNKSSGTCFDLAKQLYFSTDLDVPSDPDYWNQWKQNFLSYSYTVNSLVVTAEEDTTDSYNWTVYESGKAYTDDSDYDIVAIPYHNCLYRKYNPDHTYYNRTSSSTVSQILVKDIIEKYGENLVDVQLLPYCPLQNKIIDRLSLADESLYTEVTNGHQYTFMLYVPKSNFTFNINKQYTVSNLPLNRKIENETKLYKIVSPNYNGSFEFSVAKNGGVDYFNIDVTLIPYQPYLHININFKGLYGSDWNDAKGLICGGDFSLPRRLDQWETYKINNKNFQQIFDRQIQNLDFNQSQERISARWNIATGSLTGTATGAMAGGMAAGPYGAIAGAGAGLTTSLAGGFMDYGMLKDRQAEQRDLTADMFRYQLGNIKALPDTITKVTPLTFNNKIFPFIEVYECTDKEITLFRNFLAYQSMTVNAIGTINEYLQQDKTFIQGQLIRLEGTGLTSHEIDEIYQELNKGVYI